MIFSLFGGFINIVLTSWRDIKRGSLSVKCWFCKHLHISGKIYSKAVVLLSHK